MTLFFSKFEQCLHDTWDAVLGEEYTEEVRKSWHLVFDFILGKLSYGYQLYVTEGEQQQDLIIEKSADSWEKTQS